jgi:TRAP-type C4-dicarboxylate transport system permease small subunit
MKKSFETLLDGAIAICRWGIILTFSVLIGVVVIQVLGRLPGFPSPAWTEEVARFCLVWIVAFCCGVALLQGDLVNVDMFITPLPEKARRVVERLVDLIVIAFALSIMRGAWDYVLGSVGERARSLDVPMVAVYVVMLIIPISLTFFSIARLAGYARTRTTEEMH